MTTARRMVVPAAPNVVSFPMTLTTVSRTMQAWLCIGLCVCLASGCNDSTLIPELQAEISSLKAENAAMQDQLRESLKATESFRIALESQKTQADTMRGDWERFRSLFDESQTTALEANLKSVSEMIQSLETLRSTADERLSEINLSRDKAAESATHAAAHEAEAHQLNEIGSLKASLSDVTTKLSGIESAVTRTENEARDAKVAADTASRNARNAELKAQNAERRAKDAERKASESKMRR